MTARPPAPRPRRYSFEHPWVVRATHWLNAGVLVILIASGLEIFAAFPSFGDKIPQRDLLAVPSSMRLGGWLGGALQWHLTFQWLFVASGAVYVGYMALSGHWRQTLFVPRDLRGLWPMVRCYLRLGPKPPAEEPYNPLQKLAYTSAIGLAALAALTGWMLYKPVQLAPLVELAGGFGVVRALHFAAMCGLLGFIPGHLLMVGLHGWGNLSSMLTGWKADPDYASTPDAPRG